MSQKTNHRALTEGAISAAFFLILVVIAVYIPILNIAALLFLPLPFVIHMCRYGLKSTLLVGLVALFLTMIITPLPTVFLTIMVVSVGIVMGYFYAKRQGAFLPILTGMVTYIINYLFLFIISYYLLGINILDVVQESMQDMVAITESMFRQLPVPMDEEQLALYYDYIEWVMYAFPAIMILSAMALAGLHHVVNRPILTRLGVDVEKLPFFREWNLPKSILFYYLIALVLILLGFMEEGTPLFMIIVNIQPILEILLVIQGLSLISYFAYQKNIGKVLPIVAVILAIIIPPIFQSLIRILGIIDLGFGLKNRIKPAK